MWVEGGSRHSCAPTKISVASPWRHLFFTWSAPYFTHFPCVLEVFATCMKLVPVDLVFTSSATYFTHFVGNFLVVKM